MEESLEQESQKLARSWMQHDAGQLRDYLVASVEDPRINAQSVLSRHFLLTAMFGERFAQLKGQEFQFAAAMNWLRGLAERVLPEELEIVLHALRRQADNAEGIQIPTFLVKLYGRLPIQADAMAVPNYIEAFLGKHASGAVEDSPNASLNTFQELWAEALAAEIPQGVTVLEPACGSANDYRFLEAYGLARLVDYTGFDLCEKNVANARALFPAARFSVGNVFEINARDQAYELCFVHDLFEHLSPEALPVAVREVCRVTRHGLCAGFFQMHELGDHVIRPVDEYHWNTLSLERMRELFAEQGFVGQVLNVESYLRWQTGCEETHNPDAYTFLLSRK